MTWSSNLHRGRWCLLIIVLTSVLIFGCKVTPGAIPAAPDLNSAEPPTSEAPSVSDESPGADSTLDFLTIEATPQPTSAPQSVSDGRDTIVVVTPHEPVQLGVWSEGCDGSVSSLACADLASDPLTWIDSTTFELVPLSGLESWEQIAPDRWRFYLREGVTFHNGEPWDARAAKLGVDVLGDVETFGNGSRSHGLHGAISGQVVNDFTLDVVCEVNCPMFPRTAMYLKFQAPDWWTTASEDAQQNTTIGFGPYRIVEWRSGTEVELERFDDYQPNSTFDAQAPSIERVFQVWRPQELDRAMMVATGEADLSFDSGFEHLDQAPKILTGTTNEVYALVADNLWHPELRKKTVRRALTLAIDCETLMETLYSGLHQCYGHISLEGTAGINDQNSAVYPYDPTLARQLLAEAGYDPENEVRIYTRQGRVFQDTELWQAVIEAWQDIGVNASLQVVDSESARDLRRSGCGQFNDEVLRCAELDPPGPAFESSHYYEALMANDSLDLQRQLLLWNSCYSVSSRVCNPVPGFQDRIDDALATPLGPGRTQQLETLAQTIHDEFWFLPMFQVVTVYGMAEDLEWTPRYDQRTRINTMRFSQ